MALKIFKKSKSNKETRLEKAKSLMSKDEKRGFNIEVNPVLHKKFKAKVSLNGETMSNVVSGFMEKYIKD